LAINILANCIGRPRDQAGVIGDYLVEYLVLLPWGNREVGKWGAGCGVWGVGCGVWGEKIKIIS
jgi:hypothetical protein